MKFSVITVAYNAGQKLSETVSSVLNEQTFEDYEIIVKDGGSTDGSLEKLPVSDRLKIVSKPDKGIYDAMNAAVKLAWGEYVCFMNCGDFFADGEVLRRMAEFIEANPGRGIYYGDTFWESSGTVQYSAREITDRVCYCNVPCHQSCFFERKLYEQDDFHTEYRIRADYDFFLRQYYCNQIRPMYSGFVVARYEGGGYSESRANRKRNKEEHREITKLYMPAKAIRKCRFYLLITLAPVRKWISEKSVFAGMYQGLKRKIMKKTG